MIGAGFYFRFIFLLGSILFGAFNTYELTAQFFEDLSFDVSIPAFSSQQTYGSGVSAFDYNSDGLIDLHVSTPENKPDMVYQNVGQGKFREVAADIGLLNFGASVASLWMDYNADSLVDLLILNSCEKSCNGNTLLLFEQKPNGQFIEVTQAAGLSVFSQTELEAVKGGLVAGDLNLDGYIDFVVTLWAPGEIFLFINTGRSSFASQQELLGKAFGECQYFQPAILDIDRDGDPDIYTNVDFGPNRLFINVDFNFHEAASAYGLDANSHEMGLSVSDYDNNGLLDLFISNIDAHALYKENLGAHNWLYKSVSTHEAIKYEEVAGEVGVAGSDWGWGCTFLDFNNDGFLDIAATNGFGSHIDASKFWINVKGHSFAEASKQVGFADSLHGTSLIATDLDSDGDMDLIQTLKSSDEQKEGIRMLKNVCDSCGNFLVVRPRMSSTNYFAIGSIVMIKTGGMTMTRLISAGTSFYGQEPAEAHFGLGYINKIDTVRVIWPGGASTETYNIDANQVVEITDQQALHTPRLEVPYKASNGRKLRWNHISTYEEFFEILKLNEKKDTIARFKLNTNDRHFTDPDMSEAIFWYQIRALSGTKTSSWSSLVLSGKRIVKPTDVKLQVDDIVGITIFWSDNSVNETGYLLEKSRSYNFSERDTFLLAPSSDNYFDMHAWPMHQFFYRVATLDGEKQSEYSEIVSNYEILGFEATQQKASLYPNPTSDFLYVPRDFHLNKTMKIYDLMGRSCMDMVATQHYICVSHLSTGTYLLVNHVGRVMQFAKD